MFNPGYPNSGPTPDILRETPDRNIRCAGTDGTKRCVGLEIRKSPQYVQQSNGVSFVRNSGDSVDVWKGLKEERDIISAVPENRPSGEHVSSLLACSGVDRGLW